MLPRSAQPILDPVPSDFTSSCEHEHATTDSAPMCPRKDAEQLRNDQTRHEVEIEANAVWV